MCATARPGRRHQDVHPSKLATSSEAFSPTWDAVAGAACPRLARERRCRERTRRRRRGRRGRPRVRRSLTLTPTRPPSEPRFTSSHAHAAPSQGEDIDTQQQPRTEPRCVCFRLQTSTALRTGWLLFAQLHTSCLGPIFTACALGRSLRASATSGRVCHCTTRGAVLFLG